LEPPPALPGSLRAGRDEVPGVSQHLQVDPVACDAYGYCAELVPELVRLDEWGFPVLRPEAVAPHLLALARRAVADCPRQALRLVEGESPAPARVRLATTRR
jgi:ferredoxin